MVKNVYVQAKYPTYSDDSGEPDKSDTVKFESVPGPSSPEMAECARQFYSTKKGARLKRELESLETEVESALKAWTHAENVQKKVEAQAAADTYFAETHKPAVAAAQEKTFDLKGRYEGLLLARHQAWYSIEIYLGHWGQIKALPQQIFEAQARVKILETKLDDAVQTKNFTLASEISKQIEDERFGISCWTSSWKNMTEEELPVPEKGPEETSK